MNERIAWLPSIIVSIASEKVALYFGQLGCFEDDDRVKKFEKSSVVLLLGKPQCEIPTSSSYP
jgi:hypothetical protein